MIAVKFSSFMSLVTEDISVILALIPPYPPRESPNQCVISSPTFISLNLIPLSRLTVSVIPVAFIPLSNGLDNPVECAS